MSTTCSDIEMMETDINENEQVAAVCELIRQVTYEVLSRQKQYRGDLLILCLQFIISLPWECIDYVPAIQVKSLNEERTIIFEYF